MFVLGIETSCDETAAAVVKDGKETLSNVVNSQVEIHAKYGGVVPELASRNHLLHINPVIEKALSLSRIGLKEIDGIAVTTGPGLIGSLLVGLQTAKGLAYSLRKPLTGVNHIHAHITAIFAAGNRSGDSRNSDAPAVPRFPYIALAVSGGHTSIYRVDSFLSIKSLGRTLDDAAGEAFDKIAKLLNLPYPGGVSIDRISRGGKKDAVNFPRAMVGSSSLNFSFSGLKTAAKNYILGKTGECISSVADIAASFQEAVVDILIDKTISAAEQEGVNEILIAGGVASNSRLREKLPEIASGRGLRVYLTPVELCTDNAAMVAAIGYHYLDTEGWRFDLERVLSMDACAEIGV